MTSTDTAGQVEEPTREMWAAGADALVKFGPMPCHHDKIVGAVWTAMEAARQSPAPATQAAGGGVVERPPIYGAAEEAEHEAALATLSPASKVQTAGDEGVVDIEPEDLYARHVEGPAEVPWDACHEMYQMGFREACAIINLSSLQGKTQ